MPDKTHFEMCFADCCKLVLLKSREDSMGLTFGRIAYNFHY